MVVECSRRRETRALNVLASVSCILDSTGRWYCLDCAAESVCSVLEKVKTSIFRESSQKPSAFGCGQWCFAVGCLDRVRYLEYIASSDPQGMAEKDLYVILEIPRNATSSDIKKV